MTKTNPFKTIIHSLETALLEANNCDADESISANMHAAQGETYGAIQNAIIKACNIEAGHDIGQKVFDRWHEGDVGCPGALWLAWKDALA